MDDNYEFHVIYLPNSCFVKNYFARVLTGWQANVDTQLVFDEKIAQLALEYIGSYF